MKTIRTSAPFGRRRTPMACADHRGLSHAIETAAFADGIGVDRIGLMEQHGSEDGDPLQPSRSPLPRQRDDSP